MRMKKLALLFALAAGCSQTAQQTKPTPEETSEAQAPLPARIIDENATVEYRAQAEGKALVEVAAPPGARVDIREGQALAGRDVAPMSVKAEADHWYVVAARLPSGATREIKVQARAGQVASVRFQESAPAGPQAMSREAFKDLVHAIDSTGLVVPHGGRTIAVVGLDDIVVVDTADAVLVTTRAHAQQVKQVVAGLKEKNQSHLT